MTEPREIEWRLVEPGLWRLDGTQATIRLSIGIPLYYLLRWKDSTVGGAFTLPEAKSKAAAMCAELQEAGFEP